jgi:hypothetical protein
MYDGEVLKGMALEKGERRGWSPTAKMILAFIIGFLALLPATLGIHWEIFLP